MEHYNQERRRKAEFITPPNYIKEKVGSGGLSEDILQKAQELLESNTVDFQPLGEIYLENMMAGIEKTKHAGPADDKEYLISTMLYPAMQLKANGGMFHYDLITIIADKLIQFLEVIEEADIEAVEIVLAFHSTLKAILHGRIQGDGGERGNVLVKALDDACIRYFDKNPDLVRKD